MKRTLMAAGVLLMGLIAGCDPEALVVWAPDGKKAAVLGKDGMYLCDGEGKLSKLLIPRAVKAAWFADSQRVLAVVGQEKARWNDLEPYIGDAGRKKAVATAQRLKDELLRHEGQLEQLWERLIKTAPAEELYAGFLYLREGDQAELLKKHGDEWKKVLDEEVNLSVLRIYEVNEKEAKAGQVVAVSIGKVRDVRISPSGSAVAYLSESISHGACDLWVSRLSEEGAGKRVAAMVGWSVDWTADARSLVYVKAQGGPMGEDETDRLGWLRRLDVCDENGELKNPLSLDGVPQALADGSEGEVENSGQTLANVIFSPLPRIRCLRDGRILFSGEEVSLPSKPEEKERRQTLFVLESAKDGMVSRVVPKRIEENVGEFAHLFEVNAAQTQVAIPGVGNRLTVVGLSDGRVIEARPAMGGGATRAIPSWRNDEQVTYAVINKKAPKDQRAGEMMIWSAQGGEKKLSATWGDEVVERLRIEQ